MNMFPVLDANELLRKVSDRVPAALRNHVVVIGSIATAWAFRDVSGTHTVATKDIDLLLQPAVDAVATAERLGQELLDEGWQPRFTNEMEPGTPDTLDDQLPALRLSPPGAEGWFVELLAVPPAGQNTRKHWRRLHTEAGDFGLPSFRYMRVAIHGAEETRFGLHIARPANMALAHLLEHADPDRTPISSLPGNPPRFIKDVGRAVSLWWLAREQSPLADKQWLAVWREAMAAENVQAMTSGQAATRTGLMALENYLPEAHAIARTSVLAPHGTSLDAWRRAYASLMELIHQI